MSFLIDQFGMMVLLDRDSMHTLESFSMTM